MAFHREIEGPQRMRSEPVERFAGHHERHRAEDSWILAAGTLACPGCEAPVLPSAGGMPPNDRFRAASAGKTAAVRDFLSLAQPTRPTRVTVRVRMPILR